MEKTGCEKPGKQYIKNEQKWCVYVHTNKINGKKYVGITSCKPNIRWKNGYGYKSNKYFWSAIQKYGWDNFKHEILLQNETEDYAYKAEKCLIKAYRCRAPDGYNLSDGGTSGPVGIPFRERLGDERYEEWLKNIKASRLYGKDNPQYGVSPKERMSEEVYQQWREHQKTNVKKGQDHHMYGTALKDHMSEEAYRQWREKQRVRDRTGKNNPMYGISPKERMDEETYQQWRQKHYNNSLKGEEHPWYGKKGIDSLSFRPIYCIELNEIFWGATNAAEKYGVYASGLANCCQGKQKSTGKHPETGEKLHWFYVEDKIQKDGTVIQGAITLGYITQEQFNNYLNSLKTIQN